jgi:hypothetical protein
VRAIFGLNAEDREAVADVDPDRRIRTFEIWKRESGILYGRVEPEMERDRAPRRHARDALARLAGQKWARSAEGFDRIENLARSALDAEEETLPNEAIDELETCAGYLREYEDAPPTAIRLADELQQLANYERRPEPGEESARRLLERRPEFLFFADEHRELAPVHLISETPTIALENFLALAQLDLQRLRLAVEASDEATVEELEVAANARLSEMFERYWSQANLTVRLRVTAGELHILVSSAPGRFISIAERSDGLRQFVALASYVERHASRNNLVLLIDEAETHLHYDAQADLIKVLTNQAVAGKVIYSTHSAGCLPEDLGAGVRLVTPTGPDDTDPAEWQHSRVLNRIWSSDVQGGAFSPLLIAMGAGTFAFTAARFALVVEGITDAIMLPTLLRQAVGAEKLGFQVAPGIAEAAPEALAQLDLTAARVVYLVDSDPDGDRHCTRLVTAGVQAARILRLGRTNQGLSLEDLISRDIYLAAVQAELRERHGLDIPAPEIPDIGRARAVANWCKKQSVDGSQIELSKRAVSQRVLEQRFDHTIVAKKRLDLLRTLHSRISALLEVEAL